MQTAFGLAFIMAQMVVYGPLVVGLTIQILQLLQQIQTGPKCCVMDSGKTSLTKLLFRTPSANTFTLVHHHNFAFQLQQFFSHIFNFLINMKKIWDLIHNLHIFFPCLSLVKLRKFNFGRLSQLLFIVAIVLGSNPPLWRPFFRHHSFRSKLGTKIVEKL